MTRPAFLVPAAIRSALLLFVAATLTLSLAGSVHAATPPAPIRVLLITGGCCHDYAKQKDFLKQGLEQRANIVVTQLHTDDTSTHPPLAILGKSDYAKDYDVV